MAEQRKQFPSRHLAHVEWADMAAAAALLRAGWNSYYDKLDSKGIICQTDIRSLETEMYYVRSGTFFKLMCDFGRRQCPARPAVFGVLEQYITEEQIGG